MTDWSEATLDTDWIESMNATEHVLLVGDLSMLCENRGYGRVMQIVAKMWAEKDPLGAFTLCPCVGTLKALGFANSNQLVEAYEWLLAEKRR